MISARSESLRNLSRIQNEKELVKMSQDLVGVDKLGLGSGELAKESRVSLIILQNEGNRSNIVDTTSMSTIGMKDLNVDSQEFSSKESSVPRNVTVVVEKPKIVTQENMVDAWEMMKKELETPGSDLASDCGSSKYQVSEPDSREKADGRFEFPECDGIRDGSIGSDFASDEDSTPPESVENQNYTSSGYKQETCISDDDLGSDHELDVEVEKIIARSRSNLLLSTQSQSESTLFPHEESKFDIKNVEITGWDSVEPINVDNHKNTEESIDFVYDKELSCYVDDTGNQYDLNS